MWIRSAVSLAALVLLGLLGPGMVAAQAQQRFRLGGGAGFAVLYNPDVDHGRTADVGGSLGFRFNDSVSFEAGFNFARFDRQFDVTNYPVDESRALPKYQFIGARYHLDGSFLYHFGRREPFHPYIIAGGGLERVDEKRNDFTFVLGENDVIISRSEETVLDTSDYHPTFHVGGGFDLYFLYNVSARIEFRWWLPKDTDRSTRMFFFGATYYF